MKNLKSEDAELGIIIEIFVLVLSVILLIAGILITFFSHYLSARTHVTVDLICIIGIASSLAGSGILILTTPKAA